MTNSEPTSESNLQESFEKLYQILEKKPWGTGLEFIYNLPFGKDKRELDKETIEEVRKKIKNLIGYLNEFDNELKIQYQRLEGPENNDI